MKYTYATSYLMELQNQELQEKGYKTQCYKSPLGSWVVETIKSKHDLEMRLCYCRVDQLLNYCYSQNKCYNCILGPYRDSCFVNKIDDFLAENDNIMIPVEGEN